MFVGQVDLISIDSASLLGCQTELKKFRNNTIMLQYFTRTNDQQGHE